MATKFISFTGTGYIPDWNPTAKDLSFQGRFNQPPNLSNANAATILATLGLVAKTKTSEAVCIPPTSFTPRKLKFSFASRGSISVPVMDRSQLIPLATTLKSNLKTYLGTDVVCIELIGEEWGRMDEELRPANVTPTPGADIRITTGSRNPIYTASMLYSSDGNRKVAQSVRMNTDLAGGNQPFTRYATEIQVALGTLLARGCGGGSNIDPRHYTVKFLTTNADNPVRQLIIPVAAESASAIRSVGVGLATNTQTLCLAYNGESDSRFSRLIA